MAMPIKVTMRATIPEGVVPAREAPEFAEYFAERQVLSANYCTHSEFIKNQTEDGRTTEVMVESTYPSMEVFNEMVAKCNELHIDQIVTIRNYSASNGIVSERKIVDADTGAVIEDWTAI
jgi:hypothetical protein